MVAAELVLDIGNVVGESIIWVPGESALYWVDIVGSRIHRFEPSGRRHGSWHTPELLTSIGLCRDGSFVVGLRRRIARWRPGGAFVELAVPEPDRRNNRLNEGVVAPDGSFWVGTMQDNIAADGSSKAVTENTGALYRVSFTGEVTKLTHSNFGLANTMVWTDDDGFVTGDTLKNVLYRYELAAGRLFYLVGHAGSEPHRFFRRLFGLSYAAMVAEMVFFLVSDGAGFIAGTDILIDGGIRSELYA